jgi:hypothetical protein
MFAHPGRNCRPRRERQPTDSGQLTDGALLRFVWKIEPVASMSEDEVVTAVAPNIHRYIEGDL